MMGLLIVWRFPYHKPEVHAHPKPRLRYLDKRYRVYLALVVVVFSGIGMVQQTLGFYFQDVLHLSGLVAAEKYALAMMCSSGAMIFSQLVLVQRLHASAHQLIRYGLPFMVAGFICLSLANAMWMLALGMSLFGLGMGLAAPSFSAAASVTVNRQEQGALAGLIGSVSGMGFVLGPLLGGYIYSLSHRLTYDVAAIAVSIALCYVWVKKLPGEQVLPG
jgi:MFS family permease